MQLHRIIFLALTHPYNIWLKKKQICDHLKKFDQTNNESVIDFVSVNLYQNLSRHSLFRARCCTMLESSSSSSFILPIRACAHIVLLSSRPYILLLSSVSMACEREEARGGKDSSAYAKRGKSEWSEDIENCKGLLSIW